LEIIATIPVESYGVYSLVPDPNHQVHNPVHTPTARDVDFISTRGNMGVFRLTWLVGATAADACSAVVSFLHVADPRHRLSVVAVLFADENCVLNPSLSVNSRGRVRVAHNERVDVDAGRREGMERGGRGREGASFVTFSFSIGGVGNCPHVCRGFPVGLMF